MKFFDNKQNIYKLVKVLTPVQILLWLQVFEPFAYSRGEDSPVLMLTLAILSFGLYLMFRIFCKTASKFQKLMLGVFIGLVLVNITLGFFNRYWFRELCSIGWRDSDGIELWLKNEGELPNSIIKIYENDSVLILGKKIPRIGELEIETMIHTERHSKSYDDIIKYRALIVPYDFSKYRKLITISSDTASRKLLSDFIGWQFPQIAPCVILKKKCNCMVSNSSMTEFYTSKCYIYLGESSTRDFKVSPILFEILDGRFDERLKKYYRALEEMFWPTYANAEYENDPYFLIYQGKYKEAREGLKNLPCDRRVFCEKKLEKLGY